MEKTVIKTLQQNIYLDINYSAAANYQISAFKHSAVFPSHVTTDGQCVPLGVEPFWGS
jgi:hypothetical protein